MKAAMPTRCDHAGPPVDRSPSPVDAHGLAAAASMFRALGDPHRLRLLTQLAGGEICVTELADAAGEKISTISARLKALHQVNLVKSRREAKHVFYSLADDHVLNLVNSALEHAVETRPIFKNSTEGTQTMTTCTVSHHVDHDHQHGPACGHTAIEHQGHVDYLHDGHLHHPHDGHIDEHVIEVTAVNANVCTPDHVCAGHAAGHVHGDGCGHEAVPHGDHVDYLVDGHLHHPHEGHCDNHGALVLA